MSNLDLSASARSALSRSMAAHAPDFVAFHRNHNFPAAGVTADEAQLHAEHIDQHDGQFPKRCAFAAGADDHLLVKDLLKYLHRRVGADHAKINASVGAPEH